jgi:anthranilate phosphoribosyltransferase
MLKLLVQQLQAEQALTNAQVRDVIGQLVDEEVPVMAKVNFLTALANKGETTEEIAAFARELRALSIQPPLDAETRSREILDVCGTGGDRLNTFNISSTVAILVASGGVTVAKHGNRAVTSQSGSADVLEALGIRIELTPEEAARRLRDHQFAFFFAQKYHPAFRHIGLARKLCAERGQPTIFNFLGPLLNPAQPSAQLVGVSRPQLCDPVAHVLQALGVRRGMVVSGSVEAGAGDSKSQPQSAPLYLDELSTLGENTIAEFYQDRGFAMSLLSPQNFPLQPATLADLGGGDREVNAAIVRRLLRGEDRGPRRDAVLLNAAAALFVAGKARTMSDGWELAAEWIDSGKSRKKLEELVALG